MKRLHLIIAIVAFIALLSSSCTTQESKINLVYYKVYTIDNTAMLVTNIEPKVLDSFQFTIGDTVFVNKQTQRVNNSADSTNTMKAVVTSHAGIDTDTGLDN